MTTQTDSRHIKDNLADKADDMKQRVKDRAEELIADGKETVNNMGGRLRDRVQEKPVAALVIAAGVGLLLGLLIARKKS